jgi:HKD family nuclease
VVADISLVDNAESRLIDVLIPAISEASHVRLAVAFAKMSGFRLVEGSLKDCVDRGGHAEFLFGLDFRTTEPAVLRSIVDWRAQCDRVSLFCFSDPTSDRQRSYHPKIYVMQRSATVTMVVGSSNLTAGGLARNAEANVVLTATEEEPIVEDIFGVYHRFKLQPSRFAPDADYVAAYADAYKRVHQAERSARVTAGVRASVTATRRREGSLPRPRLTRDDLVGWQRLVAGRLPKGEFSTRDMYKYATEFQRKYPENRNVEEKIRQILQQLRDLNIITHVSSGRWRNPS